MKVWQILNIIFYKGTSAQCSAEQPTQLPDCRPLPQGTVRTALGQARLVLASLLPCFVFPILFTASPIRWSAAIHPSTDTPTAQEAVRKDTRLANLCKLIQKYVGKHIKLRTMTMTIFSYQRQNIRQMLLYRELRPYAHFP